MKLDSNFLSLDSNLLSFDSNLLELDSNYLKLYFHKIVSLQLIIKLN
jgi:hypothetical protein